ncbi:MAG: SMP-30/gluconolactonase/LRE family protein [Rhizobium sp.]|nr:SMP-30/gluconolactonase/LRE family protein [Rhizobium sp.]MBX9456473.1 SMP-30/gluconolactonase/LRE family protein [Rhizobium sp.]
MQPEVRCVVDCANVLGEVPLWDVTEQALYWVDIEGKRLHRLMPVSGKVDVWEMPERISSFALRERGGLVVAFASGLAFLDLPTMRIDWIARPEAHLPGNRFNEGKVDRKGRLWAGTMDDSLANHTAGLYRLDPDLTLTKVLGDIGISNCFIWSRANDRFWFADTLDKQVFTFDYDHEAGTIANRTLFTDTAGLGYGPDGGTIDDEGFIWIAMWDGWKVSRFAPDGRLDREIVLPVSRPTSCMFGGPDLATLYVTSAVWDTTPEDLKAQPQAGGLFAIDAGVRGLPEPRFAG